MGAVVYCCFVFCYFSLAATMASLSSVAARTNTSTCGRHITIMPNFLLLDATATTTGKLSKVISLSFFIFRLIVMKWFIFITFVFVRLAHNAVVTSAVFAPDSHSLIEQMERHRRKQQEERTSSLTATDATPSSSSSSVSSSSQQGYGYVLVSADFNGIIKVFVNRVKPKHSSLPVSALSWKIESNLPGYQEKASSLHRHHRCMSDLI